MTLAVRLGDSPPSEHTIDWESDASGDATVVLPNYKDRKLKSIKTVPDSGVTAYDMTLIDEDGLDWFNGEGLNRSTTDAEIFIAEADIFLPNQTLTLTISDAGNVQSGTVIMRLE